MSFVTEHLQNPAPSGPTVVPQASAPVQETGFREQPRDETRPAERRETKEPAETKPAETSESRETRVKSEKPDDERSSKTPAPEKKIEQEVHHSKLPVDLELAFARRLPLRLKTEKTDSFEPARKTPLASVLTAPAPRKEIAVKERELDQFAAFVSKRAELPVERASRKETAVRLEERTAERREIPDQLKKPELREKTVVVNVNPEKWTVETERRDSGSFRRGEERRENLREGVRETRENRESKALRSMPAEARETGFSELMKPASVQAPADPKRTQEMRESFSRLVERARVNTTADGTSTASMRLKPEQLGTVTLNVRVAGSQVEAKLVVESEHIKRMMKEEMEQLVVELKRQGFSVDAIDIRVREPIESGLSFSAGRDEQARDPRSGTGPLFTQGRLAESMDFEYGTETRSHEGELDIAV